MIIYTTAQKNSDLEGILTLQRANLRFKLSPEEMASQGFVTVVHSLANLRKMNEIEPHIIAKQHDRVIAYLLAMTPASQDDIPILKPLFQSFDSIYYKNKLVASYRYIVVGQVCVDKELRGMGVLDKCYQVYKAELQPRYDFAITEIATKNIRSLNAHRRIGFHELHRYTAPDGEEWSIVICDW